MIISDVLRLSLGSINERKSRFALNLLGIIIGCGAITGLVSITLGMNVLINKQLEILGADTIMILPGGLDIEFGSTLTAGAQVFSNPKTLSWRDKEIISKLTEVGTVVEIQSKYCTYTKKNEVYTTQILGVGFEIFELNKNFKVKDGRTFTRNDKSTAIIGSKVAQPDKVDEQIFEVGDRMRIKTLGLPQEKEMTFRVVGILKESGAIMGVNPDEMILIPIRTSEQLYDESGKYTMLQANVLNIDKIDTVSEKIEDTLDDVSVVTAQTAQKIVRDVTSIMGAVLGGIAAISLVVAGVGIFNTMTISVNERIKEIGILKAIGAKNMDILLLFLLEAAYTGVVGGIFGSGFGFVLGRIIGTFVGLPILISPLLWLLVTLFALATSVFSGVAPAWRAAKLNPVEALKQE